MAAARGKKKEKENGGLPSFISLEGKTGWERTVEEKVIMYYDSFSIFDRSNAMEITRTDLLKCLRSLGHDLTETQVTDHMTALAPHPHPALMTRTQVQHIEGLFNHSITIHRCHTAPHLKQRHFTLW